MVEQLGFAKLAGNSPAPSDGPHVRELILANWLAHDLFHIRQVTDLHYAYLTEMVKPVSLDYSGWE